MKSKNLLSLGLTLLLIAANLVALNLLVDRFSSARLDLTEERLFSVSDATKRLISSLDDTVVIHGYFSRKSHPLLSPLVVQIRDLLDEYSAASQGKVRIEFSDPSDNEAALDEANSRFGIESTPFRVSSKYESGIVNAFFAVVVRFGDQYVRYGVDELVEVDLRTDGEVEVSLRGLEYDLTRAIKKVVYGFRSSSELFERVPGAVTLTTLISPGQLPDAFAGVPDAIKVAVEQLSEAGGGKFAHRAIDPLKDEATEAQVRAQFGARPMQLSYLDDGDPFYLYALLDINGTIEQIPLTQPDANAASLRESIEDALRRQTPGFLKSVGVYAPAPNVPPEVAQQYEAQGRALPSEFTAIEGFLASDYTVTNVDLTNAVPTSVDTMLVLKPKGLDERQVFHLDQYLMRGGRVIICGEQFEIQFTQTGMEAVPVETGLDEWLAHHGLGLERTLVLDDQNQPLPVPERVQTSLGSFTQLKLEPYPYLVEVYGDGFAEPAIAAALEAMAVYWASPVTLDAAAHEGLESRVLLQSSPDSWTDSNPAGVARVGYTVPASGTQPHILGVALSGEFQSFFVGKELPPPPMPVPEADGSIPPAVTDVLIENSPETRLILLGSGDFVSDFVAQALNTMQSGFFEENLRFTQNLIDWVNLDSDLISIRSRGVGVRRLDPISKPEQQFLEYLNYFLPIAIVLGLGIFRGVARHGVKPIVSVQERGNA